MTSISKQDLGIIVDTFLETLSRENISTLARVLDAVGRKYLVSDDSNDRVEIQLRPSEPGTNALTISYSSSRTGIPVEIKLNSCLNYARIIFKCSEEIRGYDVFAFDDFDNRTHSYMIKGDDLRGIKLEDAVNALRVLRSTLTSLPHQ